MADQTKNYGLTKPLVSEFYDVKVQNSNMDTIDTALKKNADAITAHNANTESHPSIQVALANINARIATLELKYGTQVTGNSFEVTFENLGKVEVTGVWNETYARIEF